jgi:hypothetical protein
VQGDDSVGLHTAVARKVATTQTTKIQATTDDYDSLKINGTF